MIENQTQSKSILQLSTWELFESLYSALATEKEDCRVYQPIRFYLEGSFVEQFIEDLGRNLNRFMSEDGDPEVVRVENPEEADVCIVILPDKVYDFYYNKEQGRESYEIFEHVKFKSFSLSETTERTLLSYLQNQESHQYRTIPEKAIDLLNERGHQPGWCLETFDSTNKVMMIRDVFGRYLKDKGLLNESRQFLDFEKERFLTLFDRNSMLTMKAGEWSTVFTGLAELQSPGDGRKDQNRPDSTPLVISESWLGLRELAQDLFRQKGMSERDIVLTSRWMVPEQAGISNVDLRKSLTEETLIPLGIRQASFNDIIRRSVSKKDSKVTVTDLGRLGEGFTHRILGASRECFIGPQSSGVCDISDVTSGDPTQATWAVNVKMSLEDECNRGFEVAPEHQVSESWVLLLMPRQLSIRLYPIDGNELMTLNSRSGGLCVTPEGLADTMKEQLTRGGLDVETK